MPDRTPLEAFNDFLEHKYAWPGGYPMHAVMYDGEALCHKCCVENADLIRSHTTDNDRDDWTCIGVDINWEDPDLYCAHCNERIESAYADELDNLEDQP